MTTPIETWNVFEDAIEIAHRLFDQDKMEDCYDQCECIIQHKDVDKYHQTRALTFQGFLVDDLEEAVELLQAAQEMFGSFKGMISTHQNAADYAHLIHKLDCDLKLLSATIVERDGLGDYDWEEPTGGMVLDEDEPLPDSEADDQTDFGFPKHVRTARSASNMFGILSSEEDGEGGEVDTANKSPDKDAASQSPVPQTASNTDNILVKGQDGTIRNPTPSVDESVVQNTSANNPIMQHSTSTDMMEINQAGQDGRAGEEKKQAVGQELNIDGGSSIQEDGSSFARGGKADVNEPAVMEKGGAALDAGAEGIEGGEGEKGNGKKIELAVRPPINLASFSPFHQYDNINLAAVNGERNNTSHDHNILYPPANMPYINGDVIETTDQPAIPPSFAIPRPRINRRTAPASNRYSYHEDNLTAPSLQLEYADGYPEQSINGPGSFHAGEVPTTNGVHRGDVPKINGIHPEDDGMPNGGSSDAGLPNGIDEDHLPVMRGKDTINRHKSLRSKAGGRAAMLSGKFGSLFKPRSRGDLRKLFGGPDGEDKSQGDEEKSKKFDDGKESGSKDDKKSGQ